MTPRGLFITYRPFLDGPMGGVQTCTREYKAVIEAAGIEVVVVPFDGDHRLGTRLLRQIDSSPYLRPIEPSLVSTIRSRVEKSPIDFIFLNQVSLAPLARELREFSPASTRIVLLSHGLESTDLVHLIRLRRRLPLSGRVRPSSKVALGRALHAEEVSRANINAVFVLSPSDAELERRLGAQRVAWLPRLISAAALDWRPSGHRLGFVGTLDHGPNLEGLVLALRAIEDAAGDAPQVRVVGGPASIGKWLAGRHHSVDFLGRLQDAELTREAATWSGFIHPIFCQPRGCSTKLASAIGWRIPIVTSPQGRRGYEWGEGSLLESGDPAAFARQALALLDPSFAAAARAEVARVAASAPTLTDLAAKVRAFLDLPARVR